MNTTSDGARFLIIDDHPLFREALTSAVRMAYPDVDAVEARSIAEALGFLGGAGASSTSRCSISACLT